MKTEEKAEAYDRAIEGIQEILSSGEDSIKMSRLKLRLQGIFPELAESDDEMIRKELIELINRLKTTVISDLREREYDSWIAWLEKQGKPIDEEKVLIGARRDVALSIMNFLDRCTLGMCLSGMERADLESAVINSDWSKVYDYMIMKLEKQSEKPQGKSALEAIKEEKVDNQICVNSADKVEPKFKVGDWIVSNTSNLVYRVDSILYPQSKCYYLLHNGRIVLVNFDEVQNYHLWTISDAKDGDVLVTVDDKRPFIYRGRLDPVHPNSPVAYCGIDTEGYFCTGGDKHYYWWTDAEVHPATKEQRDTLLKTMADAGYTFDFEKKELKKIDPKFHEGEWLVDNEEGDFFKVIRVRDNTYRIVSQEGEEFDVQKSVAASYYHEFTINDAKDGDVLISEEGYPFIYASRGIYTKYLTAYCGIDNDGEFISDKNELWANDNVEPATKEQRVTLMKAMADAGFTFDFGKKELEKIEKRPLLSDFLNAEYERGKADALKCVRWSEEDEKNTNSIIDAIKSVYCTEALDGTYDFEKIFAWLKSLKDRIYWKPSEEQIYWLKWTINRMPDTEKANEAETVLKDLLEYLEKL